MKHLFNSLLGLVGPELISSISTNLQEKDTNVSSAISSTISGLLGSLLKKGGTTQIQSLLEEAGKTDILSNVGNLFSGNTSPQIQNIGSSLLESLLGNNLSSFNSEISTQSKISPSSAGKLTTMIAPLVAGFLGSKMLGGNFKISNILSALGDQKDSFLGLIPKGMNSILGLSSLNINNSHNTIPEKVKDSSLSRWIIWALLLAGLLFAAFYFLKSCNAKKAVDTTVHVSTTAVDSLKNKVTGAVNLIEEKISVDLELPSGLKLKAFKGGIEDRMITFLKSDEYSKSNDDLLKDKWFNFDNIEFVHGSGTQLTGTSNAQLNNIVEILKHYKGTKVKIGGYTDKTGSSDVNLKISQERANTIKSILEKGGISASTITAEGYGDKFAKYAVDAPDSERVHDRRIALRFVK